MLCIFISVILKLWISRASLCDPRCWGSCLVCGDAKGFVWYLAYLVWVSFGAYHLVELDVMKTFKVREGLTGGAGPDKIRYVAFWTTALLVGWWFVCSVRDYFVNGFNFLREQVH